VTRCPCSDDAYRQAAGVEIGDEIEVELALDLEPRIVTEPSASPIGTSTSTSGCVSSAMARATSENVWNGRPISLIVLSESLDVLDGTPVSLIELVPPVLSYAEVG
jgi:predicted metalloenzyme YecM